MAFVKLFEVFVIIFFAAQGMKVIPESLKVEYVNEKYIKDGVANIRRFSRIGDYYLNVYGETKHTWANNITINIIVTQFLHNEYRRSFIEFHFKFCDMINKDPMLGAMLKMKGLTCPTPKGKYRLTNMTIQSQNFPNVWPFEKGGADVTVTITDTGELVTTGFLRLQFKDSRKKG